MCLNNRPGPDPSLSPHYGCPSRKLLLPVIIAFLLICLRAAGAAEAGVPAEGITIFAPESLTCVSSENTSLEGGSRCQSATLSTTVSKVSLVGRSDAGPLDIQVVNNGRAPITPVFHDNYFHARLVLSLGVNDVEVRWRKDGGAWSRKTVSIFRSSKVEGGLGASGSASYPPYTFHKGDNEEHCQQCHQMGITKAEKETGMERSCLQCHKDLTRNPYVHGPVGAGLCTVCHDPLSTPNKYKVEDADNVLCYHCHDDRKDTDNKKKLLHGPVGAGLCTVCHDPHSSPFKYQLVRSRTDICLMCHGDDVSRWMGRKSLHPPFRDGNCVGCHDPHSSDFKYNLKKDQADLCSLCHQIPVPGHLHDIGKTPQFKLPADFPLAPDGTTMCLTCHDPHGAPGAHVTRRDGCDGCHVK